MSFTRIDGPASYAYEDANGAKLTVNGLGHMVVQSVIRKEVDAVREACARIVEKYAAANAESDNMVAAFLHCAAAIRDSKT
jgi:hypothetical protein